MCCGFNWCLHLLCISSFLWLVLNKCSEGRLGVRQCCVLYFIWISVCYGKAAPLLLITTDVQDMWRPYDHTRTNNKTITGNTPHPLSGSTINPPAPPESSGWHKMNRRTCKPFTLYPPCPSSPPHVLLCCAVCGALAFSVTASAVRAQSGCDRPG